jgi:hypothetical protein
LANAVTAAQDFWKRHPFTLISVPLLLLALLLVAWQPLLTGHLPWHGDGLLHLYRLGDLERAVRAGDLFPRWSADLGYGFGFPLYHYYAPFSYYVGLVPRLLGLPLTVSLQTSYALALLALAAGAYLWARAAWPGPQRDHLVGVTAALATLYAPYILFNTYHRAALAELWGLAWLVIGFWAVQRMAGNWRLQSLHSPVSLLVGIATLAIALLLLSHNITALLGIPLLVAYAIFQIRGSKSRLRNLALPLFLGLGLAAFFWLPAFLERGFVQIENLTAGGNFAYTSHFLTLSELFAWPKTAIPSQVNPPVSSRLGWPAIVLALLAWLPVRRATGNRRSGAAGLPVSNLNSSVSLRLFLTLLVLLSLFMTLPASRFIWDAVALLAFVQFPWRFLGLATIGLGALAGLGARNLASVIQDAASRKASTARATGHWLAATGICLLFPVYALPWLFPGAPPALPTDLSPQDTIRFEAETGWLGTTSAADYLPRSVQSLPPSDSLLPRYDAAPPGAFISRLNSASLPDTFSILSQEEQYTTTTLHYSSREATPAVFDRFSFPGWRATLDGQPLDLTASRPYGLITAVLPPGDHTVRLTFASTPLRTAANALSWLSLLLFVFLALRHTPSVRRQAAQVERQSSASSPIDSSTGSGRSRGAAQLTIQNSLPLLLVGLFFLKTFYLDHADTPFRRDPFDGQSVAGVGTPAQANFGDELMLLGFDLSDQPIPADRPIALTLYWRSLPPVAAEYSVSVQLFAANGRRYAQSDSYHPAGLPVTRWQAGEFAVDAHSLALLPAARPGDYRLALYVYDPVTGRRLDLLSEAGLPLGNEYPLGVVSVALPGAFPDPSSLPIAHRDTEGGGPSPFLAENVQLLGFDQPVATSEVGQILPLTLYWHTPQTPARPSAAELALECQDSGVISRLPISAPDSTWHPGQTQRADCDVLIAPLAEDGRPLESGLCTLYLSLSAPGEGQTIALQTFPLTAPARTFDLPSGATLLGEKLAGLVTLAAFTLDENTPAPGQPIHLDLYWQPHQTTTTSYTVFVQLLGPDGRPVAQQDQVPGSGHRPTTGWLPGEIVRDEYTLTLPAVAPPGVYQLVTGLYDSRSGERLPLGAGDGDAITLPVTIEVKTAE